MELSLPKQIPTQKIARYLGYHDEQTPDATVEPLILQACSQTLAHAKPRGTQKRISLSQAGAILKGNDIEQHIKGCSDCLLIAVTLGTQMDDFLRRSQTQSIAKAVAIDAAASVLIEQVVDQLEENCRVFLKGHGEFLTQRFSPGYGDCPLDVNHALLAMLDAQKRIGLTATSTHLLAPRKSITAICGISSHPVAGKRAGCDHCVLREKCSLRKKGLTCGE